jgi:hypothetical protein
MHGNYILHMPLIKFFWTINPKMKLKYTYKGFVAQRFADELSVARMLHHSLAACSQNKRLKVFSANR